MPVLAIALRTISVGLGAIAKTGNEIPKNFAAHSPAAPLALSRHWRCAPRVQSSSSLPVDIVSRHDSPERQPAIVIEAIVNSSV